MNAASTQAHESVARLQAELFATSSTVVNSGTIQEELAFRQKVKLSEKVLFGVLSPTEQQIIEVAREKQYSEVLIQKDGEGEATHIKITKRGVDETLIKKLQCLPPPH